MRTEQIVIFGDLILTQDELDRCDTPERLRNLLDAKIGNLRKSVIACVRADHQREVA